MNAGWGKAGTLKERDPIRHSTREKQNTPTEGKSISLPHLPLSSEVLHILLRMSPEGLVQYHSPQHMPQDGTHKEHHRHWLGIDHCSKNHRLCAAMLASPTKWDLREIPYKAVFLRWNLLIPLGPWRGIIIRLNI